MIGKFDYNNEDVMNILSNASYTDEQKKELFEKYKANLKDVRRKEIINRLNECAKNNPIITQDEYITFLKKYNEDDLSKPFEVIEEELKDFSDQMDKKYKDFLAKKEAEARAKAEEEARLAAEAKAREEAAAVIEQAPVIETPVIEETIEPEIIIKNEVEEPKQEDEEDLITPSIELEQTVFENNEIKEIFPDEIDDNRGEKGNASTIIISIIAIIIGIVIMYAIIKLK